MGNQGQHMTRGQRQALKVICLAGLPAAALAVDGWFYVSMKSWTYSLPESGAAVFWPGVLMFGALFFPLAAFGFGSELFQYCSTHASARWPVAEGRVTGGRIEIIEVARGKSLIRRYETYLPVVSYAYEVAGTRCSNDIPATRFKNREEAEEVLRSYPVGTPLQAHYDPDDPGTADLQTGDGAAFRSLGAILLFAAAPFLMTSLIIAWH
jgi:Protein of unknown function (DUF3592)